MTSVCPPAIAATTGMQAHHRLTPWYDSRLQYHVIKSPYASRYFRVLTRSILLNPQLWSHNASFLYSFEANRWQQSQGL